MPGLRSVEWAGLMGIKFQIPSYLQSATGSMESVEVEGDTIGQCLRQLTMRFPALEEKLFTTRGELHPFIGIYINNEDAYPDELSKPVQDGDEVHILYVIGGG